MTELNSLKPFQLNKNILLKNRTVLAPMTTEQNTPDGTISESEISWLERMAACGVGMIITGGAAISNDVAFKNQLSISNDITIPKLSQLIKRLNPYNTINILQIMHGGTRSQRDLSGCPNYGVSAYTMPSIPNFQTPIPYSIEQIEQITLEFTEAAKRAHQAGFHGVEIHGANGYLITQFLSTMTNLRTDEYGGSLTNRAKFIRDIIRNCRRDLPKEFVIGVRLTFENSGLETGLDIDEIIQVAKWIIEDGVDYIHYSSLNYTATSVKYSDTQAVKYVRSKLGNFPLIICGGINSQQKVEDVITNYGDLAAMGRVLIGNPEWIKKGLLANITPMPYKIEHLEEAGISSEFINYMTTALKALKIVQEEV